MNCVQYFEAVSYFLIYLSLAAYEILVSICINPSQTYDLTSLNQLYKT